MSSNLYSQNAGITSSGSFPGNAVKKDYAPTPSDIKGDLGLYPIGQLWVDRVNKTAWMLVDFDSTGGSVAAVWIVIGGGSTSLSTLSGDTGTASPIGGNIDLIGGTGIVTAASGDQVVFSLSGGDPAIDQIAVDAFTAPGTNPVKCDVNGEVTITGTQVAAGSTVNAIQTNSLAVNSFEIQVQRAAAVASSTIGSNGVSHFNSAQFSVDDNGFVGLAGGGQAIDSVGVETFTAPGTNPVLPTTDGLINISGGQVAAGTTSNAIRVASIAANSILIEAQRAAAVASSTVGSNGVSHFNSSQFSVDSNGFVSSTVASINRIDGDVGFMTPTAGVVTLNTGGQTVQGTSVFTMGTSTGTLSFSDTNGNTGLGVKCLDSTGGATYTNATALGSYAGNGVSASGGGTDFVAIGYNCVGSATPSGQQPSFTVAVGSSIGSPTTNGVLQESVLIGANIFKNYTTQDGNCNGSVIIGTNALLSDGAASGINSSVLIGQSVGDGSSFDNSIIIGEGAGQGAALSNCVYIGDSLTGFGNETNVMRLGNSTNTRTYITGVTTNSSQPAFYAYNNATVNDVTGDTTTYTIIFNSTLYDQASNFNTTTGTFTAPVDGIYYLKSQALINGGTAISIAQMSIVTPAGTLRGFQNIPLPASTIQVFMEANGCIKLTAGDAVTVTIVTTDSGGKVDDLFGGTGSTNTGVTFFTGYLIC